MTNYTYLFRKWSTYLTMQNLSSQFGILSNLTMNKSLFTNPNSKDQYLPEHFRKLVDTYAMTADSVQLTPLQVFVFFCLIYKCVYMKVFQHNLCEYISMF